MIALLLIAAVVPIAAAAVSAILRGRTPKIAGPRKTVRRRVIASTTVLSLAAALVGVGGPSGAAENDMHVFSGTVTADDGAALANMRVSVLCQNCPDGSRSDPAGNAARPWPARQRGSGARLLGEATTGASGEWSVTVAEPASGYPLVLAWDPTGDYAFAQIGSRFWSWADSPGLDATLTDGGRLSGRILADGGALPATDFILTGYGNEVLWSGISLVVAANGSYRTPGLPDGDYRLIYPEDLNEPYVGGGSFSLGTISGGQNAVVDHQLIEYTSLSGRVTDGSGRGLSGIEVIARQVVASPIGTSSGIRSLASPVGGPISPAVTAQDGTYSFDSMVPGLAYGIEFRSPDGEYVVEYYDNKFTFWQGDRVEIPGEGVSGIDAQLARGSTISGFVEDSQGLPVPGTGVRSCAEGSQGYCQHVSVDRAGFYVFSGLAADTYQLTASPQYPLESSEQSVVLAENSQQQVDFEIQGGRISGTVANLAGVPVPGSSVTFRLASSYRGIGAVTVRDGTYTSPLLAAGDYTVDFNLDRLTARHEGIAVTNGATTSGVDAAFDAGFIEGTVTSSGQPLADVNVSRAGSSQGTTTSADGTYKLGTSSGDHPIRFSSQWHVDEYYDDQIDRWSPSLTTVSVSGSSTTTGIDADLAAIPPPTPPPDGTEVSGQTSSLDGIPVFRGADTMKITHQSCPNGRAGLRVVDLSTGASLSVYAGSDTPAGSGTYVFDVPLNNRLGGRGSVKIDVSCATETVSFSIYVDPSGTVQDENGSPISGATVTLMRDNPNTVALDFEVVADGSVLMDPEVNNTNPDVTGADGQFRWDVVAGLWKVRAEKDGCHAPGDASVPYVETPALVVPPPRLGLVMELECGARVGGVHAPAIAALSARGVFEGTECDQGQFCPSDDLQRWVMAVWLVRILDGADPNAVSTTRFSDVDSDEWWATYVERLAELEVTVGCTTEPLRYCPDQPVSRAQMATFLTRAFDLAAAEPAGFTDTEGSTHAASIDALAAAGVTVGCTTEPFRYCPSRPVTRAQMATLLARALGLLSGSG